MNMKASFVVPSFPKEGNLGQPLHSWVTQKTKDSGVKVPFSARYSFRFFMFIGLLDSWQSPECSRDLRFE